jgi:plastocyanin
VIVGYWRGLGSAAAVLASLAIAAGCAGEPDDASTSGKDGSTQRSRDQGAALPPVFERPEKVVTDIANRIARARSRADCRPIERVNARSAYDYRCPESREAAFSLRFFGIEGSESYGTGAVVDFHTTLTPDEGTSIVLAVTPGSKWSVTRYSIVTPPTVRTSDADSRDGFDSATSAYLDAVRSGGCHAYATRSRIPEEGDGPGPCRGSVDLGRHLRASAKRELEYLGGNGTFGFYGLTIDGPKRRYWTVSVMRRGDDYGVLDAVRGPQPRDAGRSVAQPAGNGWHDAVSAGTRHRVVITDRGYRPRRLRIGVGDRVTFVNSSRKLPHSAQDESRGDIDSAPGDGPTDHSGKAVARASKRGFATHSLFPQEPQTVVFPVRRRYAYYCTFHSELNGSIDVVARRDPAR